MNGPGVAFECPEQNGLHIWEDYVIPEIINPQTLEPVPEGEIGELVLTTINREAMPLLRYRTRDLTRFIPGECPCGRTHRRLARFVGRSDDMLIEVELSDLFTDDYSALQRLAKEVTRQLKDELLLTPRVKLVGKGSLPSAEGGKAVRVKDLRKLC